MADNELIFYTNPMSRGRMVRWMLEEMEIPYKAEIIEYGPTMKSGDYLAINPMGKVPALRHGDQLVTETPAILAYLADAFPETALAPPSGQRGAYYRWLFYGAGCVEAALFNKKMGFEPDDEQKRTIGYGSYEEVLDTLEAAVTGRDYIAGDSFTAADIYIGSEIGFGLLFGSLEKRPAFENYFTKLANRSAYQKATRIDDELIAAAQEKS